MKRFKFGFRVITMSVLLIEATYSSCANGGLISLEDCPHEDSNISVTIAPRTYQRVVTVVKDGRSWKKEVDISNNGKEPQVYFFDVDFDGFIDVLIGSEKLVFLIKWDKNSKNFIVDKNRNGAFASYPVFSTSEKAYYALSILDKYGCYRKYRWDRNSEKPDDVETMYEVFSDNYDYSKSTMIKTRYTVAKYSREAHRNVAEVSCDDISGLPERWQEVVAKMNMDYQIDELYAKKESENIRKKQKGKTGKAEAVDATGIDDYYDAAPITELDSITEIEDVYDAPITEIDNYTNFGTNGTLQLKKTGYEGSTMSPNTYFARYGNENDTFLRFNCYPHSKFGKKDFAELIQCDNLRKSIENISVMVPSYVDLDGKEYKVERVTIVNSGGHGYPTAGRLVIPSTVKQIKIWGWTVLKEVVLNEGFEELNERAFRGCPDLKSIVLPKTLKKIGKLAFENCSGLTKIHIPASVNDVCDGAAFVGLNKGVIIEVENGCEALKNLKPINVDIRGTRGYEYYKFNPDDINIVYVE